MMRKVGAFMPGFFVARSYSLVAFLRAAFIRDCQFSPVERKNSKTSESTRSEISWLAGAASFALFFFAR